MTNFLAILFSIISPVAISNAPSWLNSGLPTGWWDSNICRTVELSWPATNGTYRVQWIPTNSPAWLWLTQPLNAAETNRVTVQLAVPDVTGYFRAVKLQ